jgi:hypothetical protein
MLWGVRSPNAHLYLVVDDYAADVVADEWERSDCQLVWRAGVHDTWHVAALEQQQELLEAAHRARERRQPILGLMEP